MYSFYGGRPGNSFVITKTYSSKEEMLSDFSKGDNCQVHYDEYVLINNSDRLNKQHGNIYRRAYGTDATTAAVFIGNIAGPPGAAPLIDFVDYDNEIINDEQTNKYGHFSLVPGRAEQDGTTYFNNEIKWKSITKKNENNDDSTTYIGVQVPYPVFDFEVESANPYSKTVDTNGNLVSTSIADTASIKKISNDEESPFYQKWKFSIPRGINGNSLKDIKIILNQQNKHRQVFGTLIDYSQKEEGQEILTKIGDLGFINEIESINKNGNIITINLTDNSHVSFDITPTMQGIIQAFTYDKNTGKLEVNDGQSHVVNLKQIKNIFIDSNGNIQIVYTNGQTSSHSNQLKILKSISMRTDQQSNNQIIEAQWTNETQKQQIGIIKKYITDIKIDNNTNHLFVKYTGSSVWTDLGSLSQQTEFGTGELGSLDWIGVGILNHIAEDDNTLTFNIPLNKSISNAINEITVTEGSIFSENNFILLQSLSSTTQNIQIKKTNSGLTFTINSLTDAQIFPNLQTGSEEESTQIALGAHYLNLNISNLILALSINEEMNDIENSSNQESLEEQEEEVMPDTSSETDQDASLLDNEESSGE